MSDNQYADFFHPSTQAQQLLIFSQDKGAMETDKRLIKCRYRFPSGMDVGFTFQLGFALIECPFPSQVVRRWGVSARSTSTLRQLEYCTNYTKARKSSS